jgi:hypothetical protein
VGCSRVRAHLLLGLGPLMTGGRAVTTNIMASTPLMAQAG